jgi:hypothetical protein
MRNNDLIVWISVSVLLLLTNGAELNLGSGDELPVLAGIPIQAGNVEFAPATITFIAIPQAGNIACQ